MQLAYTGSRWAISGAYTYSQNLGPNMGSFFAINRYGFLGGVGTSLTTNAYSINGYWQPSTSGWIPSISAGWGHDLLRSPAIRWPCGLRPRLRTGHSDPSAEYLLASDRVE